MLRREFSRRIVTWLGLCWVWLGLPSHAWGKIERRLLPADTERSTLIYEDPAELDASLMPVTPLNQFGVSGTRDHRVDLETWRLVVEGLVETPRAYSFDELMTLPPLERKVLLICPGTFAYVARWRGFSLWPLLQQIGLNNQATHVDVLGPPGPDQKTERFPLTEIRTNQVFLAMGANGVPLPLQHGFPLRVVAEGHVGAEWVKYVYGIRVVFSEETTPVKSSSDGAAFLP